KDYVPLPYIKQTYEFARNHKWYMEARMITVHDLYAFDPNMKVSLDPFIDIIGRHFKQPKEGLGFDNSPVAHMWRSLIYPDNPLGPPGGPPCDWRRAPPQPPRGDAAPARAARSWSSRAATSHE